MKLTKIDVAEAHICAAVRMFFEAAHPAPIFMIANAAREIVEQIGTHIDVTTAQEELARDRSLTVDDMLRPLKAVANFLKHADRDPTATIDIDDNNVEVVLQLRATTSEGWPAECR